MVEIGDFLICIQIINILVNVLPMLVTFIIGLYRKLTLKYLVSCKKLMEERKTKKQKNRKKAY